MNETVTLDEVVLAVAKHLETSPEHAGQMVHDLIQDQIAHTMVYLAGNIGIAMEAIDRITPPNTTE